MAEPMRIEIDGDVFSVDGDAGQYHYTWVSGRNPGYGFTDRWSDGRTPTRAEHEESLRGFLTRIDPATGYLEE
jgi:hypothetical protein